MKKLAVSALCGIVFALAAGLTLFFLGPILTDGTKDTENAGGTETELPTEEPTESESQEPTEEPTEPVGTEETPTVITVPSEVTLEDYQRLLNQMYVIGNRTNKSIVTITSVVSDVDWFNNPHEREGQGVGTIIEETAGAYLILTERRLITDASKISVTFIDDTVASAELMKYDGNTGLAVLSVKKSELAQSTQNAVGVIPRGNSALVRKGMLVLALGSPLGTNYSVLTGMVTSTNGELMVLDSNYTVFTTDIIADRNSGGILINTKGELVGIVVKDDSVAANTLSAISVSEILPMIELLVKGQDVPYLGVYVSTVSDKIAKTYNLPMGVYVKQVRMDSPAMNAGIQSGDVIVEINGQLVSEEGSFYRALLQCVPDENCQVVIMRQGGSGSMRIVCDAEPGILE